MNIVPRLSTASIGSMPWAPTVSSTSRAVIPSGFPAYAMAGIVQPQREIDVAELYDCFSINTILQYEDLGFAEVPPDVLDVGSAVPYDA